MKNIGEDLKKSLADSSSNMVRCFRIKPKDGDDIAFTEHSAELIIGDVVYKPRRSFEEVDGPRNFSDMTGNSCGIVAIFDDVSINASEVFLGKFDGAKIDIFMVNCEHVEYGSINLISGFIDSIEISGETIYFSIAGVTGILEKTVGDVYSPLCRAEFCDKKCGLAAQNYTFFGEIATVDGATEIHSEDNSIKNKDKDYFRYGSITFIDGKNKGSSVEVKQSYLGGIILSIPPVNAMEVGDQFKLMAGCDKKFDSCSGRFANAINFRGEPNLPRTAKVYKFY
ncbi:MAG: DUF2163 domain-containing protein [Rickettsiales bacterium]|jgi:uncharacterized phage protein (TIGR02218 family)|nr:DUF2163 domain-containing protein [Rickettsiales bacterium]